MRTIITYSQPVKSYQSKLPRTPTKSKSNNGEGNAGTARPVTPTSTTARPITPTKPPYNSSASVTSPAPSYISSAFSVTSNRSQRSQNQNVQQSQQQQQQRAQNDDTMSTKSASSTSTNTTTKKVDLTDLLKHIERREWMCVVKFFEKCPTAPKQKTQSGNYPLHESLKHNPPLPVVNLLLEIHNDALREKGAHGYLPLHVACNCRNIRVDVVSRLIMGYPSALRTREPTKDCLPLHLAVQTGVSEDVLMELLTNYPEASFIQDNSGKIALDYANESVHHHNRSIVALETAPILLAAAQAAQARVSREYEYKVNGLREAHTEYTRQLQERFEDERTTYIQEQIKFSNELANEKERNIALAEKLLEVKNSEKVLKQQRDELQEQFDQGMKEFRTMIETQEAELRLVLESNLPGDQSMDDDGEGKEGGIESTKARSFPDEASSLERKPLKTLLEDLRKKFDESKAENLFLQTELSEQLEMVRHLNELLTAKDDELISLRAKLQEAESAHKAAAERADKFSDMHEAASKNLEDNKKEASRLKELAVEQELQIEDLKRKVTVQRKQMGSIKGLVNTLNMNIESWTEESGQEKEARSYGKKMTEDPEKHLDDCSSLDSTYGSVGESVESAHVSELKVKGSTVVVDQMNNEHFGDDKEEGNRYPSDIEEEEKKEEDDGMGPVMATKQLTKGSYEIYKAVSYETTTTAATSMDHEDEKAPYDVATKKGEQGFVASIAGELSSVPEPVNDMPEDEQEI